MLGAYFENAGGRFVVIGCVHSRGPALRIPSAYSRNLYGLVY